jgi:hypothetical protein
MSELNAYKLSDAAIAQVAKLLQMAMLTGTDIVDNLRTLELVGNDGVLDPAPGFIQKVEDNVSSMMDELEASGILPEAESTDG